MNEIDKLIEELNANINMLMDKICPKTITCQHCNLYILNDGYYRCLCGIIVSKLVEMENFIWEHQNTTKKTE